MTPDNKPETLACFYVAGGLIAEYFSIRALSNYMERNCFWWLPVLIAGGVLGAYGVFTLMEWL